MIRLRTLARPALAIVFFSSAIGAPLFGHAQTVVDQLKSQIQQHTDQISSLQAEIAAYQKQLDALNGKRQTLESAVQSLEISRQKLSADIAVTQNKIERANLRITELSSAIGDKEEIMANHAKAIAQSLRTLLMEDQTPLVEQMVSRERLADLWEALDAAASLKRALSEHIAELSVVKNQLVDNRDAVAATKKELIGFQSDLVGQRGAVEANKAAQQSLLKQTKNQESSYQQLVAKKQAEQEAFEDELLRLESALQITIDPSRIPSSGKGVLSWPFSKSFMASCQTRKAVFGNIYCVTQYFGNTAFATANPQIYSGKGHNGIDIAAPIGTPIHSALSGVVAGIGDTDLISGCYSYGKWLLVKGTNGLSTVYGHLSGFAAKEGQTVSVGDVIAYSGMSGYSTGPHLHLTVIATQGLRVMKIGEFKGTKTGCSNASVPLAPTDGYLNPMSYL